MQLKTLSCLLVLLVIVYNAEATSVDRDCEVLRLRCEQCVARIHEGPNEDNLLRRLNDECREKTANVWIWRDLKRCELANIRCRNTNIRLTCGAIARAAGMTRIE